MHPNEIPLVFKNESGTILPTRERTKLLQTELTTGKLAAIQEQTNRQIEGLKA